LLIHLHTDKLFSDYVNRMRNDTVSAILSETVTQTVFIDYFACISVEQQVNFDITARNFTDVTQHRLTP